MFLNSWLPNIVCTIVGCLVPWLIGYRQGKAVLRGGYVLERVGANN